MTELEAELKANGGGCSGGDGTGDSRPAMVATNDQCCFETMKATEG